MKDKLIHYIDLLFAGAPEASDIKQEILQNTLDRYDDLIAQGKSPEAAYRLAISGIGDIGEILGDTKQPSRQPVVNKAQTKTWQKILTGIGVGLYILCPIPLFILQNEIGLCGLLGIVAVATVLVIIAGSGKDKMQPAQDSVQEAPKRNLPASIRSLLWSVCVCAYLILSFTTHAWHITWVLFPLTGCIQSLIEACLDLKKANRIEKE